MHGDSVQPCGVKSSACDDRGAGERAPRKRAPTAGARPGRPTRPGQPPPTLLRRLRPTASWRCCSCLPRLRWAEVWPWAESETGFHRRCCRPGQRLPALAPTLGQSAQPLPALPAPPALAQGRPLRTSLESPRPVRRPPQPLPPPMSPLALAIHQPAQEPVRRLARSPRQSP